MFAISTSDYAVACGDRPSSPQTRREKFLEKNDNQESSRRCVVTPCSIYIKRTPSSYYDIQCVDAVLVKVNKTPPKGYEKFYLDNHKHVCPVKMIVYSLQALLE